jgi:pimeloyl-ACP methyl ester carboxylesterase
MLQVYVHNANGVPSVSADLSDFGLSSSATTSGQWVGYGAQYYPAYYYDFGPLVVNANTANGTHVISITATDSVGSTTTAATSVTVDNVLPTVSISRVTFSTTSPQEGDYVYFSGSVSGTGSRAKASQVTVRLSDATGNPVVSPNVGGASIAYDAAGLNDALAASTDGSFANVPIRLLTFGDTEWLSRSTNLSVEPLVYDEAGNFGSGSLTVPIPRPLPPDPCVAAGTCVSNVLFLPGIEGSRLYEGTGCGKTAEEKLWEPFESTWSALRGAGDRKVEDLFLNQSGAGVCSDIYTKEGDIIDAVNGGNIYASLINEMDGLKSDGTINDWRPVAYDWRLSLDDLLSKGAQHGANIFYEEATSTPYIEQTLRSLAARSKTGKVTIVAHSNGGLVVKALLERLGGDTAKSLVDRVIMVGVPQSGAPADVGAMLVGYNAGIYALKGLVPIVSNAAARSLTQNSPMAYHLLPSQDYFDSVMDDSAHPVARFAGDGYTKEISAYGPVIGNLTELDDFLLARDGGRVKPSTSDLKSAEILNQTLIDYANSTHAALDAWTPPAGIEVTQIAGWGVDTVGGVDFYTAHPTSAVTAFDPYRAYRPIFIEDGDGTVPVPSALMMASSTNVKRYWLDLDSYFLNTSIRRKHADLFEIPSLQDFIKNILKNSTSTLPSYISETQLAPLTTKNKLTFFLHSPLTLELQNASGNVTGLAEDGSVSQGIPDSTYGEFGEVKYITVPQGNTYQLTMHGQANGTFSLEMQESSGSTVTALSTIANVPTTANTLATLSITGGVDTASALTVDEGGDGGNVITITPRVGETVSYEPPQTPIAAASQAGAGGSISIPAIVPVTAEVIVPIMPTATTSPPEVTESTQTVLVEKVTNVAVVGDIRAVNKLVVAGVVRGETNKGVPQTASAYEASQQPMVKRLGEAVYNGLHRIWRGLKIIFSI